MTENSNQAPGNAHVAGKDAQGVSPRATADVLTQIAHLSARIDYDAGLKPAQWAALRYFSQASERHRTISAYAVHNGVTPGAASQVVDTLVRKELAVREPSQEDRRVVRICPTDKALELLKQDPHETLTSVIASLGEQDQLALARIMSQVLVGMLDRIS